MSLRREVITDPNQICPIKDQVRSIKPWWRRALCTLLIAIGGCAESEPTLGDAVDLIAEGTCERWIRCGWTDLSMDRCEWVVRNHYCERLDCGAHYDVGPVQECFEDYVAEHCSEPVAECTP